MLSRQPCGCDSKQKCAGFITTTELRMAEMNPSHTAQHYHEVMELFEDAFDGLENDGCTE